MKVKIKAYIDIALAMSISGSAVVASKMMVSKIPTFLATAMGLAIGLLILLPMTFLVKKEAWRYDLHTHMILLAQALCGVFLYRIVTFVGLEYTTAATSGLITSASPVILAILAFFILKEYLSLTHIIGITFVFLGLLLINLYSYFSVDAGLGSMKGNVLILAAVLCESLFSILSKAKCMKISALCRTTIIAVYAFLLLLPFSIHDAVGYDFSSMDIRTILCLLYYGVFVSYLSYVLWFRGIEKVQASNAAVFTSMVPICSIILSAILLKEKILPIHIISLIFIVVGIWISCLQKTKIDNSAKKLKLKI